MSRDEIIERTGAENWQQVVTAFENLPVQLIKNELDEMFPTDDNGKLAQAIYNELN